MQLRSQMSLTRWLKEVVLEAPAALIWSWFSRLFQTPTCFFYTLSGFSRLFQISNLVRSRIDDLWIWKRRDLRTLKYDSIFHGTQHLQRFSDCLEMEIFSYDDGIACPPWPRQHSLIVQVQSDYIGKRLITICARRGFTRDFIHIPLF